MTSRRVAVSLLERHDGEALYDEHRTSIIEQMAEIAEVVQAEEEAHAARCASEPGPWARRWRAEHEGGAEAARKIARRLREAKGR